MKVRLSAINFKSNYTKGKEEFNKLPKNKQMGYIAHENYRRNNHYSLSPIKGELGEYVRHRLSFNDAVQKALKKFIIKKT